MSPNKAIIRGLDFVPLGNDVGTNSPYISTRVVLPCSWAGEATEGVGNRDILVVCWTSFT